MERVYKYPLEFTSDVQSAKLPLGATVLHFDVQRDKRGGIPTIWAKVDPGSALEPRNFLLRGTGHPIEFDNHELSHIGTALDGVFVWHLFELI